MQIYVYIYIYYIHKLFSGIPAATRIYLSSSSPFNFAKQEESPRRESFNPTAAYDQNTCWDTVVGVCSNVE